MMIVALAWIILERAFVVGDVANAKFHSFGLETTLSVGAELANLILRHQTHAHQLRSCFEAVKTNSWADQHTDAACRQARLLVEHSPFASFRKLDVSELLLLMTLVALLC